MWNVWCWTFQRIRFTSANKKCTLLFSKSGWRPLTDSDEDETATLEGVLKLDKLQEKGLVSYIIQSKTKHYQPSEPKEILNIIEDRVVVSYYHWRTRTQKKYSQSKQVAIVYEGFKSFKALFNKIEQELKKGDSYWVFAFKNEYYSFSFVVPQKVSRTISTE